MSKRNILSLIFAGMLTCSIAAGQSHTSAPLFTVKTNLLFDVVSVINVELEVPIGSRWSVAGEYIFPWWLLKKKQNCLQLINGNVEGRYWFGNPGEYYLMTGWFAGIYAGGGKMLHAGDPIGFADLSDSYWVKHFYAAGRLAVSN